MRRAEGLTFGEAADVYDRVRPGYPQALIDAVVSAVPNPRRALEAGAGTGHATVPLVRRGVAVEAVEPDERMAAIARARCAGLAVRIRELRFEDWDGPAEAFDLVVCAQAWHWLDHARAADVAARALRPDGVLAVWWNRPRAVEGPVLEAVRRAYHRHAPGLLAETSLLDLKATPEVPEEVRGFRSWRTESFGWRRAYDASSYAALMSTQGDHRLLPGEQLARLIGAVQRAIEEHANRMAYEFTADLSVAKRLPV